MTVLRNPFPPQIVEEINLIVQPAIRQIKNNINVHYVNNAATFISEEALKRKKKLHESLIDTAGEETNMRNFDRFLLDIKSNAESNLFKVLAKIYDVDNIFMSGSFYYPDSGYMGWHTNHSDPSTVVYIVYADQDQKSFFRYEDEKGKIITDYDDKGLTIRQFELKGTKPYFWHCVGSTCNRFSFGFRIRRN